MKNQIVPVDPNQLAPVPELVQPGATPPPAQKPVLELADMAAVLKRHKVVIAFVTVIVSIVIGVVVMLQAPVYKSTATVRYSNSSAALTGGIVETSPSMALARGADPLLSQVQIVKSRAVTGMVVDMLGMRLKPVTRGLQAKHLANIYVDSATRIDSIRVQFAAREVRAKAGRQIVRVPYGVPLEIAGVRFTVVSKPGVNVASFKVLSREKAIDALIKNIKAKVRPSTDIIDIDFQSKDRMLAERTVNAFATAYQQYNTRSARDQSRRKRVFVQEQLARTDSMYVQAQSALNDFRTMRQVYSSHDKSVAQQQAQLTLESAISELDADQRMYRTLAANLLTPNRSTDALETLISSPGIASNTVISQLFGQYVGYETERDKKIAAGNARSNPDVRALDALMDSTSRKLRNAVQSHISSIDAKAAALKALYARNTTYIRDLTQAEAQEAELIQRVEAVKTSADALRQELQQAGISEAVEVGQIELLDLAAGPGVLVTTQRRLKILMGVLAGLLLGIATAFLIENLNTSIRRRDELELTVPVPALGVLPQIAPVAMRRPFARRNGHRNKDHKGDLVMLSNPRSAGAEAFRALRTNLIFSQAIFTLKSLVVTSSSPAEGKTTTSANLAITFAQQGIRVAVVDCDLRRPQLHKVFGAQQNTGVTRVILGEQTLEEALAPTSVENLFVMCSGPVPPNPTELLGGTRMRLLLEKLESNFDLVILDSPPILLAADAAVLGTIADGVLLVVCAGMTERGAAMEAYQQLVNVGARVVGTVLNDRDAHLPRYDRKYGYGYYGYGRYYSEYHSGGADGPIEDAELVG